MSKLTPPPAEAYLAAIVSSSEDAIVAHDLDGTITLWNTAAERLFGYSAAEAVGHSTLMLFPPDRRDEEIATLKRVWQGQDISHFETVVAAKDGSLIDVSLTISPILNTSGQVIGASIIVRDIRERTMAELAQLRLAAIVQSSDDPIISKDLNGIVTSWNPAAERVFGYSAKEIVGRSITVIIPASRLDEEKYVLDRIRAGLSVEHFETVRQTKDGELIDISLTVSPIRNAAGRLIGASKIARDIRERKQSDMAALRLGAIVESSDDAIVSKDLNGIVTSWNAAAERMFGYTADEMIGQSITRVIPPERLSEETYVLGRIRAGLRVEHFETIRHDKWGRPMDISLTVSPIRAPDGRVIGASKIARDITKHKLLLESQRDAQAREEAARRQVLEIENRRIQEGSRLKGEFVANMSHELRTPLNSIIGFAEMMADERLGPMPPKYARFSSLILKSAGHLLQLINDILDLAKVESGKIDLKPERVQLAAVVEDVASIAGGLARQRDIRIETVGRTGHRRCAPRSEPAQAGALQLPFERHQVLTRTRPRRSAGPRRRGRSFQRRSRRLGHRHQGGRSQPPVRRVSAARCEHGETAQGNRTGPGTHEADRGGAGWIRWRPHGAWSGQHVLRKAAETRHRPHGRRDVERSACRIGSVRVRGACE